MKRYILSLLLLTVLTNSNANIPLKDTTSLVTIETKFGEIVIKLYNETPLHKANFIKLIQDSIYENLLFHRVIKGFMIQGGDPDSKNAKPNQLLGEGGLNYTVPAEFNKIIFHKRGVLAAARESDKINPLKASSSTQFYIVQGKTFTLLQLSMLEQKRNQLILNEKARQFFEFEQKQQTDTSKINIKIYQDSALNKAQRYLKENPFSFTEEQKHAYTNVGGAPHLDGNYTVFGEVITGMEIIDIIANLPTDQNDRPKEDIKFKIKIK